jgi:hypothetical protein
MFTAVMLILAPGACQACVLTHHASAGTVAAVHVPPTVVNVVRVTTAVAAGGMLRTCSRPRFGGTRVVVHAVLRRSPLSVLAVVVAVVMVMVGLKVAVTGAGARQSAHGVVAVVVARGVGAPVYSVAQAGAYALHVAAHVRVRLTAEALTRAVMHAVGLALVTVRVLAVVMLAFMRPRPARYASHAPEVPAIFKF